MSQTILLEHAVEHAVEHTVEHTVEHAVEHTVEHTVEHAVENAVEKKECYICLKACKNKSRCDCQSFVHAKCLKKWNQFSKTTNCTICRGILQPKKRFCCCC
jgi:phage baseplate assembly protein W